MCLLRELVAQFLDGLVEVGAGGILAAAESVGDLAVGEALVFVEDEGGALFGGQGEDGGVHAGEGEAGADGIVDGCGAVGVAVVEVGEGAASVLLEVGVGGVGGDLVEPGAQVVGVFEAGVGLEGAQKGFLQAVLGVGGVLGETPEIAVDLARVGFKEGFKIGFVGGAAHITSITRVGAKCEI